MSANLITAPPARAYNDDDTFIEFATNLVDSDPTAKISLDISASGPSVDQVITIEWGGQSVAFTVASTVNAEATAWPVKSGAETLADYALRVAEAIRQNGIITDSWQVLTLGLVGSAQRIQLRYRTRVVLPITVTSDLSNVVVTETDGTDPLLETNLSCHMQLWKVEPAEDDDTLLGALHSPYDVITGTTQFNLKGYFDLSPHLPTPSSIYPGLITSWPHGVATSAWVEYYFRCNDKFGAPAIPLALIRSDENYVMLHGSKSADYIDPSAGSAIIPLHSRRQSGGVFYAPLSELMADYAYFWALQDLTACNVEFIITWSDGTDTTNASSLADFSLAANKIHWVRSTPKTFGYAPPSDNAFPEFITFRLKGNAGDGVITLMELYYVVKINSDYMQWVIFDNGLGGCETALFYGKSKNSLAVTREIARRQRTSDFSIQTGELVTASAEGQRTFEMSTGWVPRYYAEHLQQMLLGDTWLIDQPNKRFQKMICTSSNLTTSKDDELLVNLEITFQTAWIDSAING